MRHARLLALVGMGASLTATASAWGQTHNFTLDADFDSGVLTNVVHKPANQLVLGPTEVSKTTLVWVDNYVPGWIVRIDATTGKQTSRFDSALQMINGQATGARPSQEACDWVSKGNCPGRVAVDTNGDVWIVNRAFGAQGTLSKFSGKKGHCIDRNNNGVIDTSSDLNTDGVVNPADPAEYLGQDDECILTTIPVGAVGDCPRSVAVDKKGKIWVGSCCGGFKVYRFNPNEPVALEATIQMKSGACMYSAASGGDYVFFSNRHSSGTVRIHIDTLAVEYLPGCTAETYGVVADPAGGWAWLGGYSTESIRKADFTKNPPTCTTLTAPGQVTAMTLDLQGNVWAAGYGDARVHKYSPAGVLMGSYSTGSNNHPHGLSVDFQGNIWAVQDQSPHLIKFNASGTNLGSYSISAPPSADYTPYLYSDFTGVQIDRIAPYARVGLWDGTYDGGVPGIPWSKVTWNAEPQGVIPTETSLVIAVRAADTQQQLGNSPYVPIKKSGDLLVGVVGRYVQVKVDFNGPGYITPVLSDINVVGPCVDGVSEDCCVVNSDCNDQKPCTEDLCPVPGGICTHSHIPECCTNSIDCNDENMCTTDACVTGKCQHEKLLGCCMSNLDCNDGIQCTADHCSGPGGSCSNVEIKGCCMTDDDCTKGNLCSASTCPVPGGLCTIEYKPGCCQGNTDCSDNDLCTIDTCDLPTHSCSNTDIESCCNKDSQCFDNDECTKDQCSGPGGQCNFLPKPNCCTPTSPQVGKECDGPVSPNDGLPCIAGHLACENNELVCKGAVMPQPEQCNWVDDDCDGSTDENSCPQGTTCVNGLCVKPCGSGEFPCDSGFKCKGGLCLPTFCEGVICQPGKECAEGDCIGGDGGTAGSAGSAGGSVDGGNADAAGFDGGLGGNGGSGAAGGQSGAAQDAGTSGTAGSTAGTSGQTAGSAGADASNTSGDLSETPDNNFGMTTGGGGCKCTTPGQRTVPGWSLWIAAGLGAVWAARRRRRQAGRSSDR